MGRESVMYSAYTLVNGISRKEMKEPKHVDIIENALNRVWAYEGLYQNETEDLREVRLDIESAAEGDANELSAYFRKLYPDDFKECPTAWGIIYTMYNRMIALGEGKEVEPATGSVVDETPEEPVTEASDKNIINKEANDMADKNTTMKNLSQMEEGINPTEDVVVRPTGQSSADNAQAASALVNNDKVARLNFTKNAKIKNVVVAKPTVDKILAKGAETTGTVKDIDAVMAKVAKAAGIDPNAEPLVATKCTTPEEAAKAVAMYEKLRRIKHGANETFDIYVGKGAGTIKGYEIVPENGVGSELYLTQNFMTLLITKSAGFLAFAEGEDQVQIKSVEAKDTNTNGESGQVSKKKKSKANPYAGVSALRFTDRKAAIDKAICQMHTTSEVKNDGGLKSKDSFKFFRDTQKEDGSFKTGTYRLPLIADQFVLATEQRFIDANFGDGTRGVGQKTEPISINDTDAMKDMMDEIAAVVADATSMGVAGEFFNKVRQEADKIKAAGREDAMAAVEGAE